jgi:hypothetical protein
VCCPCLLIIPRSARTLRKVCFDLYISYFSHIALVLRLLNRGRHWVLVVLLLGNVVRINSFLVGLPLMSAMT